MITGSDEREQQLGRLRTAKTAEEWRAAALELDRLEGRNKWKEVDETEEEEYDPKLIRARLQRLQDAVERGDIEDMRFQIRTALTRDLGGMGNVRLYRHCHIGTKSLIEKYIETVSLAIDAVVETSGLEPRLVGELMKHTRQAFGRSALLLSGGGTLGMNHIGVVKALFEARVLPRIISGASAGSIVCSVLCTKTDEEMPAVLEEFAESDLGVFEKIDEPAKLTTAIKRLLTKGVIYDIGNLKRVMRGLLGDLTFLEAYNRTQRILSICVSSASAFEAPRLHNYVTAPDVVIWSAVAASCSVPLVFNPTDILAKDRSTGIVDKWDEEGGRWIDGSVDNDLPMTRLAEMLNVNHFIVSQVNPHVVPFLSKEEDELATDASRSSPSFVPGPGWMSTMANLAKGEALHRLHVMSELGLWPTMTTKIRSVLGQRYAGDITILPEISYTQFPYILSNPTKDFMEQALFNGERATWPKISRIRNHLAIELKLDEAVRKMTRKIAFSSSQVDLRMNQFQRSPTAARTGKKLSRHGTSALFISINTLSPFVHVSGLGNPEVINIMEKDDLPRYSTSDEYAALRQRREWRKRILRLAVLVAFGFALFQWSSDTNNPKSISDQALLSKERLNADYATCSKLRHTPQDPSGPREANARWQQSQKPVLIRIATVWTGEALASSSSQDASSDETYTWIHADVYLEKGLIQRVEPGISPSSLAADYETWDAKGRLLTAGIVDIHSHAGVDTLPELNWRYMKCACGENAKRVYGEVGRDYGPFSRMGEAYYFRHAFEQASNLVRTQDDWCDAADRLGAENMPKYLPAPLEWETLAAALRGQVMVNTHCYTIPDLEAFVRHTNEFNFSVRAFHHAHQTYLVPEILKRAYGDRPPAAALFADNMYYKAEAYIASEQAGKVLYENGITPVFLGLVEIAAEEDTQDGSNDDSTFSAALDGLSMQGKSLAAAYSHGVTRAISAPASSGEGRKGVSVGFRTGAKHSLEEGAVWEDEVAVHYTLTLGAKTEKTPSLSSAVDALRRKLLKAVKDGKKDDQGVLSLEDAKLKQVVKGEMPLVLDVHSADTIASLLRMKIDIESAMRPGTDSADRTLRLILFGGAESHLLAEELATANVSVILAPLLPYSETWEQRRSLTGAPLTNGTAVDVLHAAGVQVAISTKEDWETRDLGLMAGIARANSDGKISEDEAWSMVSSNIYAMLGLDSLGLGSTGATAGDTEFVVYDGNPLEIDSRLRVVADGRGEVTVWT
ncbi:putative esterase of the alpha-beta hydrolase superfamily [Hortaea werneckii]|nr:putative esterase of the alpha-beta hydrolase superfamily [Hortaea werneckii]